MRSGPRLRIASAIVTLAVAVAATACGSSTPGPQADTTTTTTTAGADATGGTGAASPPVGVGVGVEAPDPCALVTTAEIAAATRTSVGDGELAEPAPFDRLGQRTCSWTSSADRPLWVVVSSYRDSAMSDGYDVTRLLDDAALTGPLQPAPPIGDEAVFATGRADTLHVRVGDTAVTVLVTGGSTPTGLRAAEVALAAQAANRLRSMPGNGPEPSAGGADQGVGAPATTPSTPSTVSGG